MRGERQLFTYSEALDSFPLVEASTHAAIRQIEAVYNRVQSQEEHAQRQDEIESAIEEIVEKWTQNIIALGCEVKGLWLVDWDSGDGYYCWRYPEASLAYFHSYEEGFPGRIPMT